MGFAWRVGVEVENGQAAHFLMASGFRPTHPSQGMGRKNVTVVKGLPAKTLAG
jgi:hypothetical protein